MSSSCIISQVHIPDHDVQGNLNKSHKLKLVEYGISHLRKFNPHAYIILTGHGHKPKNIDLCDYVYWENECKPLNEHGYVIGMPAQFPFVSIGIEHALSKGFEKVLKTRGDCIIGIPNIVDYCDTIVKNEQKQLLITQQTGPDRMGDCFMFGDSELLRKIWSKDNKVFSDDGLQNTAHHFLRVTNRNDWSAAVHEKCAFRDVDILKFTCLRWNFHQMCSLSEEFQSQMLDPSFCFERYHWGKANGWHAFAEDRSMTGSANWLWSQKEFYKNG